MQGCGFCTNIFSLKYINKKLLLAKVTAQNIPVLCNQKYLASFVLQSQKVKTFIVSR